MAKLVSQELLSDLRDQVEAIVSTTYQDFLPLNDATRNSKPFPGAWSINECLEHLNQMCHIFYPLIEKGIQKGNQKNWTPDEFYKPSLIGRLMIRAVHPENEKKYKTRKGFNPEVFGVRKEAVNTFLANQEKLISYLQDSKEVSLNRIKIPFFFGNFVKGNLGDTLRMITLHERRHMNQAIHVLEKLNKSSKAAT